MTTLVYRAIMHTTEASEKTEVYAVNICFATLAMLAVIFRMWARYRSTGFYGWDDWLVVVSLMFVFVGFALSAIMVENGLGWETSEMPAESTKTIFKAVFANEIAYVVVLAVTKVTILVMYCRVFPLKSFKTGAWILSIITVVWSLIFMFLCVFQCTPIPRAWNHNMAGKCLDLRSLVIGNAIPNILLDVAVIALPIWQAWQLQMKKGQKIALTCIFLLGSFASIASICRLVVFSTLDLTDVPSSVKNLAMWSQIEVSVAVISACLPTMRPLLTAFLDMAGSSWSNDAAKENANIRDCGTSEVQNSTQESTIDGRGPSVIQDAADMSLTAEQLVSYPKILLQVMQIQKSETALLKAGNNPMGFSSDDDIC